MNHERDSALLAARSARAAGDHEKADRIAAEIPPTDVNDPRHAAWYTSLRMAELDRLEDAGRGAYAREQRAALAAETRAAMGLSDAPERLLSDAEMAALRAEYGV